METYKNLCAQFYALDKPEADDDSLKFYMQYAKNAKGPIFEPMCGTGRFLIPMLENGFDIEGADASPFMLNICKEKCATKNLKPTLFKQFLHEMDTEKKYALIFIPSGSFGLITDEMEAKNCLKILYDHLLPSGKLLFEVELTDHLPELEVTHERQVNCPDGGKIVLKTKSSYEAEVKILHTLCQYQHFDADNLIASEVENFEVRLYAREEIDLWLRNMGIKNFTRLTTYNNKQPNDEVVIYECTN